MPDEQAEVSTPWGKVKGIGALVIVVMALALGGVIYLVITRSSTEHQGIVDSLKSIGSANESISEKIEEQNAIILMDEKERANIKSKLRLPPSLLKKLRDAD